MLSRLIDRRDGLEYVHPPEAPPAAIVVVDITLVEEATVAVPVPPPSPTGRERLMRNAVVARLGMGDRWILHKKHHVQRLDGRIIDAVIPEFLKSKKVRQIK